MLGIPDGRPARAQVERQEWALGAWERVTRSPDPRLRDCLAGPYQGWREHTVGPLRRREVATAIIPIIINLGADYRIMGRAGEVSRGSFVAGLHDTWVDVEGAPTSCALQLDLTPLGAWRLLGDGMTTLANATASLDDVAGHETRELVARLHDSDDWDARFDLVDAFLLRRLSRTRSPQPEVCRAWQAIVTAGGRLSIGALARDIGWSQRHFADRFRAHLGVTPKTAARIVRFEHAIRALARNEAPDWPQLALACGYYDQAHLINEFGALAGLPPTSYLARRIPGGGGLAAS